MQDFNRTQLMILFPLLFISLCVFYLLSENYAYYAHPLASLVIGGLLIICNLCVLTYHWLHPAHPKYGVSQAKKIILCIHLIGGSLELICSLVAILIHSPNLAILAASAALLLHIPTAILLTPDVFGAKGIMVPSYTFIISLNAFFAVRILIHPIHTQWVVSLFFSLNIYVLCRVFFVLFRHLGLFPYARYTAAIFISCLMVLPVILGALGNVLLLLFIGANLFFIQKLKPDQKELIKDLYIEHDRTELERGILTPILDRNQVMRMIHAHPDYTATTAYSDKQLAKMFFDQIDSNHNGLLDKEEWLALTESWPMSSLLKERFFCGLKHDALDFEEFYQKIWCMDSPPSPAMSLIQQLSDRDFAFVVYKQLDLYGNNKIEPIELAMLFTQWGLRTTEIEHLINKYQQGLSFEDFYQKYVKFWSWYRE